MSDLIELPDITIKHNQTVLQSGVSMHYITAGNMKQPRDGKIVLFVHGWRMYYILQPYMYI